jgi:hypothetical protein
MRRTARRLGRGRRISPLLLGNTTAPTPPGGGDTDVSAALAALTLTENPAAVALDVAIAANVHALTLTGFPASLDITNEVMAGVAALTLTEQQAAITFDVNVTTALAALTLTERQATVLTGADIPAVVYAGGAGFLVYEGATHGESDGAVFSGFVSGKFRSGGSEMVLLDIGGSVPLRFVRNADDTVDLIGGTSGAVFSNSTTAVPTDEYGTLYFKANGTTAQLYWLSSSGLITGTNTPGSATDLSLSEDWHIGETTAGGSRLHFNMSAFALFTDDIDWSDADNREEVWDSTAHKLRNPGAGGANLPWTPVIFNASHAAAHGVGADSAGLFTDDTSPGVYADDYAPAGGSPSMDFSVASNSMYVPVV